MILSPKSVFFSQTNCIDKCVFKFSNVNQKVMGIYVEAQTAINQRRMEEVAAQQQEVQSIALPATTASDVTQTQISDTSAAALA